MISIILPCYNCQDYIDQAIRSVTHQIYPDWELLIVNDGSTDNSHDIIEKWAAKDARVRIFHQQNGGVSKARNTGLSHARGQFLCFLDADDWLPPTSLESRLRKFETSDAIAFVDGWVQVYSEDETRLERTWKPGYRGNPHRMLLRLSSKVFFGPSWMIRLKPGDNYRFNEDLRYGEDLYFYIQASKDDGAYDYIDEVAYCYRNRTGSAMKNIDGVMDGYLSLRRTLTAGNLFGSFDRIIFEYKIRKIMVLTYLRRGEIAKAMLYLVR